MMLDDSAFERAQGTASKLAQSRGQAPMSESQAEVLASAVEFSLSRVVSRLDSQLDLTVEFKERLLQTTSARGRERLAALEMHVVDMLEAVSQGWSTLGVVLRSAIQGTEAKLETAGQRDLAIEMGSRLGDALSHFDSASQEAFDAMRASATNLSDASQESIAHRVVVMHSALREYRRNTNSFAHSLHGQFQGLSEAVGERVSRNALPLVAMQRVNMSFAVVKQSAAAAAWKVYSSTWVLATGVLLATADLGGETNDFKAQISQEAFAGEALSDSGASAPMKPAEAQSVTMALDRVDTQVDGLMNLTKQEARSLLEAVNVTQPVLRMAKSQALIRQAIASVLPGWRQLGELLRRTSRDMMQCLEVAGQAELARRLSTMVDEAAARSDTVFPPSGQGAEGINATLEEFVQQQDVLAHQLYRAFSEFFRGLYRSHGFGRAPVLEVALTQNVWFSAPQRFAQDMSSSCAAVFAPSTPRNVQLLQLQDIILDGGRGGSRVMGGTGSIQEVAAVAWKIHSAAWVLVAEVNNAMRLIRAK